MLKTIAPGIQFEAGVPSISAYIAAAVEAMSVPSAAAQVIAPKASPSCTIVSVPIAAARDFHI